MSDFCAPNARLVPISLRRSKTLASMIFIMPIPPTISEMLAMELMTMVKIF